jgi:uncharacterized protein (TIGR02246 family)
MTGIRIGVLLTLGVALLLATSDPQQVRSQDKQPAVRQTKQSPAKKQPAKKQPAKKPAQPPSAEQAIRESAERFVAAFDAHNAAALAAMWTPEGEYIDATGQTFVGRKAIEQEYARFFESNADAKLLVSIDSIRVLGDSTAIEDGRASLSSAAGPPGMSRYTAVHVLEGGKWLMASVRDTRVAIGSNYQRLAPLEQLVGEWTAEHLGARADVSCRWIARKSCLQLDTTVTRDGHVVSESTEIIGWDPLAGSVRSWSFSSDGGRAVGTWRPSDVGWVVAADGVTPNGTATRAVYHWALLADGALGWNSFERTANGVPLEDVRAVVLKRVEPAASADR